MDWFYQNGKKRVGPIDDESFKEAIISGKINDTTLISKSGMKGWQRFAEIRIHPDISSILPNLETGKQLVICANCNKTYPVTELIVYDNKHICPNCKPEFVQRLKEGAPLPEVLITFKDFNREIIHLDYDLKTKECLENGFALLKNNFWAVVWATFIVSVIFLVMYHLIPLLGTVANLILSGPLIGGLFHLFIRLGRNKYVEIGDVFNGLKGKNFLQLMLAYAVPILFLIITIFAIVLILAAFINLSSFKVNTLFNTAYFFFCLPVFLLIFAGLTYLVISWSFTLPLIIDKELYFWTAMQISYKMVNKHSFQVFGLFFLSGLVGISGIFLLGIGLLVTLPIFFGAMAFAYIEIFKG